MNWNEKIALAKEQFTDVVEALPGGEKYKISLVCDEKPNPFGGNPTEIVTFSMTGGDIPYKEKVFEWHIAGKTEDEFVDEVKAYLLDVLDGLVNL